MFLSNRSDVLILYVLSAALHELGHLWAARALGIGIKEIRFELSGIRICTEEKLTSYKNELFLAVAGPLVNFLVLTLCITYFSLKKLSIASVSKEIAFFLSDGNESLVGVIGFIALVSFVQGGVNLLPIKTFDGGRAVYCLLAFVFNEKTAQAVIELSSALFAFALWTVALYLLLRVSAGLGVFVFSSCIFFSSLNEKGYLKKEKRLEIKPF